MQRGVNQPVIEDACVVNTESAVIVVFIVTFVGVGMCRVVCWLFARSFHPSMWCRAWTDKEKSTQ